MTLKISSNKINPTINLFLLTLKKNSAFLALVVIVSLLFCPGYILTVTNGDPLVSFDYISEIIIVLTTVATSLLSVLLNLINFSYLYSKKASDVFHSIPITRTGLLLSRFFAGLVFSVIPMVVIYFSAVILTLTPNVIGNISILAVGFVYNLLTMILTSAISLLFIICAGSIFDMVVSFSAVNIGTIIIVLLVELFCDRELVGYVSNNTFDLLAVVSPFFYCSRAINDYLSSAPHFSATHLLFFIKIVISIVILLAVCVLLYRNRKAEKAGESYAFKFMFIVCGIIISLIGAFGAGMVFSQGDTRSLIFYIFAVIGAIITAVIYGAISSRGFKTVKSSIAIGGTAFASLVIIAVVIFFGAFGYETRIPDIKNVESVNLYAGSNEYEKVSADLMINLHKKVVKNLDKINDENSSDGNFSSHIGLNMDYKLKNGKNFSRTYFIPAQLVYEELLDIHTDESHIAQHKNFIDVKSDYFTICSRHYKGDWGSDYTYVPITYTEVNKLIEAYSNDIKKATVKSIEGNCDSYQIESKSPKNNIYKSIELVVEPHFEETLKVIEEINIPSRIDEQHEYYK